MQSSRGCSYLQKSLSYSWEKTFRSKEDNTGLQLPLFPKNDRKYCINFQRGTTKKRCRFHKKSFIIKWCEVMIKSKNTEIIIVHREKKSSQNAWALTTAHQKYSSPSSCFNHHGGIISSHFLLSSTGCSPCRRNGPGWWRADLGGRSFKESRNISEQWSDRLRQTAARVARWIITTLHSAVFSSRHYLHVSHIVTSLEMCCTLTRVAEVVTLRAVDL